MLVLLISHSSWHPARNFGRINFSQVLLTLTPNSQGRPKALQYLLAAGADPHYPDSSGQTPFDHAILNHNDKCVQVC
jgi:hypothetical protein